MKIQIRQGVFETNSSSVHTLSISKSKSKFSKIKDSITKITFGENCDYYWYCDSRDVFNKLFAEDDETFTILLLNYIYDKSSYTYCFDDNYFDETEFRNKHKDFKNYCAHD